MKKKWILLGLVLVGVWWVAAAPRAEMQIAPSFVVDPSTATAIAAVDHSAEFAASLVVFPSKLHKLDDAVFVAGGATGLFTATDGNIWSVDIASHAAQPLVEVPLMAYGIHEVPGDPNHVYFCSSRSHNTPRPPGAVGLYRLSLDSHAVEAVVTEVPVTDPDHERRPVVYADSDAKAPELRHDGSGGTKRALAVCDNLDVSEDGRRVYFTEPFDYVDASVGDAIDEAIAVPRNGRLWRYDVDTGSTRLIAEGYHFINGVLHDLHPGQPQEESVVVTQTFLFRLTRFYVRGPKAGTAEVVIDGLSGMDDGIDRDAKGRIWVALFSERDAFLTWVHAHAWLKPLLLRVPTSLLLRHRLRTGVVVLSPDGSKPLYSAMYDGPTITSVATYAPGPDVIYLGDEPLDPSAGEQKGFVGLQWPPQLPR
jgi:sugar lactone lactonase YvrE